VDRTEATTAGLFVTRMYVLYIRNSLVGWTEPSASILYAWRGSNLATTFIGFLGLGPGLLEHTCLVVHTYKTQCRLVASSFHWLPNKCLAAERYVRIKLMNGTLAVVTARQIDNEPGADRHTFVIVAKRTKEEEENPEETRAPLFISKGNSVKIY
jgi:hypothetical protein